jgi:hypothetical protein
MPRTSSYTETADWRGLEKRVPTARPPARAELAFQTDYVYFIQAVAGGAIKIGLSQNPGKRLTSLQTARPDPIRITRLVAVHRSRSKLMEQNLHRHFEDARMAGEWFEPVPELVKLAHGLGWEEL